MEKVFKIGDIITDVFDTGIVKEYNKDTDTITFCIKISWNVDNPTIELNSIETNIEHFTKATPREKIKAVNFLNKEGYIWDDKNGVLIDTYENHTYDIIRKNLTKNNWYKNDETGECFLMKDYTSKEHGFIGVHAFIDNDKVIHIDENIFKINGNWRRVRRSEEKKLFCKLSRVGYLWNDVKNELVYVGKYNLSSKEKDKLITGDFIVNENTNEITIFKEQDYFTVCGDKSYTAYYITWASMELDKPESISVTNKKYSMHSALRFATLPEINDFLKILEQNGYTWSNKNNMLTRAMRDSSAVG